MLHSMESQRVRYHWVTEQQHIPIQVSLYIQWLRFNLSMSASNIDFFWIVLFVFSVTVYFLVFPYVQLKLYHSGKFFFEVLFNISALDFLKQLFPDILMKYVFIVSLQKDGN